jgi:pimeloyl-ACP methyl ester carboxylesterase
MATSRSGRQRSLRPSVLALAVLAGLLLALAVDVLRVGGPGPWLARRGLPPPYLPLGHRLLVDGRAIYRDCRGQASPTVILEAGSGSDSAAWSAVHDSLASFARTCAYDRPGRGRSDAGPRHTLEDSAMTLRGLLEAAGEPPPYLLVGHSLGGSHIRVYAAAFPGQVTGVVLVDSFDPDLEASWIHPLLGALRAEYEQRLDGLRREISEVDGLDWPASEAQLRAGSIAGLPVEVLRAPRQEPRLDSATNEAIARAWLAAFESLSPGKVRSTTAWGAGHQVQIERPDLVIEAVRRIVSAGA